MNTSVILPIAALCAAFTCIAHADDDKKAEALAKSSGCMVCHAVDAKVIGPSYKDVAAKYRNTKNAEAILMKKVKDGGSGVWGQIPMPPHPSISDADLKVMVDWVLSSK